MACLMLAIRSFHIATYGIDVTSFPLVLVGNVSMDLDGKITRSQSDHLSGHTAVGHEEDSNSITSVFNGDSLPYAEEGIRNRL